MNYIKEPIDHQNNLRQTRLSRPKRKSAAICVRLATMKPVSVRQTRLMVIVQLLPEDAKNDRCLRIVANQSRVVKQALLAEQSQRARVACRTDLAHTHR